MKSIYKYRLDFSSFRPGGNILTLRGQVLSAGVQGDDIMIWAVHDDSTLARQVRVCVMGTGHPFVVAPESDFVGTVFLGPLVFHVFATVGMIGEELS